MNLADCSMDRKMGGIQWWRAIIVLLMVTVGIQASRADDALKLQFSWKLHTIVENSDAIVGIAVKNLATGEEFFINENEVFPQASSIKIHILAELYHQVEQGKYRLSDVLPLPASVRVEGGGCRRSEV